MTLSKTFVKKILGDSAESVIHKNTADIRKRQKELNESRERERKAEQCLNEQNEVVMSLNEQLNKEKAKIEQLKD